VGDALERAGRKMGPGGAEGGGSSRGSVSQEERQTRGFHPVGDTERRGRPTTSRRGKTFWVGGEGGGEYKAPGQEDAGRGLSPHLSRAVSLDNCSGPSSEVKRSQLSLLEGGGPLAQIVGYHGLGKKTTGPPSLLRRARGDHYILRFTGKGNVIDPPFRLK